MEDPLLDTEKALHPLLEAAKASSSSNVSTIRALVMKVLSHPSIFCGFDDIKDAIEGTLAASGGDGDVILRTLDLFSYGRYNDYLTQQQQLYLTLTETQETKLRQLTVISVVQDASLAGKDVIPYDVLAQELGFGSSPGTTDMNDEEQTLRRVEESIISCIYAHILNGSSTRLCQKTKSLWISSHRGPPCRARDVPISNVSNMIQSLEALQDRLELTHKELGVAKASVTKTLHKNASYWSNVTDERRKKSDMQSTSPTGGIVRSLSGGGSGGGAAVAVAAAGWPESGAAGGGVDAARRSSTSRRQSKRSRGGLGGSFHEPFQRF